MPRRFDHGDLQGRRLSDVRQFNEQLLPALGVTRDVRIEGWRTHEAEGDDGVAGERDPAPVDLGRCRRLIRVGGAYQSI